MASKVYVAVICVLLCAVICIIDGDPIGNHEEIQTSWQGPLWEYALLPYRRSLDCTKNNRVFGNGKRVKFIYTNICLAQSCEKGNWVTLYQEAVDTEYGMQPFVKSESTSTAKRLAQGIAKAV
ncbi:hypothetical protein PoB_004090100 [Plakobranchus ocellatus]|uniref:Uncharacterized protein n=1 Tax=Plakobranchus ocellatus TaxID=259542 RepID=A0AAV4ATJ4_9GAST|nr:hypothetical protein PoB_004090100 [Plakobranchus ocellatus]